MYKCMYSVFGYSFHIHLHPFLFYYTCICLSTWLKIFFIMSRVLDSKGRLIVHGFFLRIYHYQCLSLTDMNLSWSRWVNDVHFYFYKQWSNYNTVTLNCLLFASKKVAVSIFCAPTAVSSYFLVGLFIIRLSIFISFYVGGNLIKLR